METTNQQPEMEMTPEQLEEQKERMLEFYKTSMPYLKAQLDYEKLLLEIDEARFKRSSIQYQFAMMMNPPQDEEEDLENDLPETAAKSESRKLKRG
jgi:hypothetical protein